MTPPRRALIVVDVQNEYFTGNLPIEHPPVAMSLPNIARAMDAAHAAGVPIVVVRHTASPGAPVFDEGTDGWQLHPEVASRPRDHLVTKTLASVFPGTGLADWLAARSIETVTAVGYMTHNCVVSTLLEVHHMGLKAELLSDASGSLPYANAAGRASAEEIHRVISIVLHSNFAAVVSTDAWLAAVAGGHALEADNVVASNRRGRSNS